MINTGQEDSQQQLNVIQNLRKQIQRVKKKCMLKGISPEETSKSILSKLLSNQKLQIELCEITIQNLIKDEINKFSDQVDMASLFMYRIDQSLSSSSSEYNNSDSEFYLTKEILREENKFIKQQINEAKPIHIMDNRVSDSLVKKIKTGTVLEALEDKHTKKIRNNKEKLKKIINIYQKNIELPQKLHEQ